MKLLAAVVAWVSLAGASTTVAKVSAQVERPFVFYRVCNIEPGQDDAAVALAQDMVDIASKKYPAAEMSVTIGRWMTGFQTSRIPSTRSASRNSTPTSPRTRTSPTCSKLMRIFSSCRKRPGA